MSVITNRISGPSLSTQALEFAAFAAAGHALDVLCEGAARTLVAGLGVDCCHIYKPAAAGHDLQFVAGHGSKQPWAQRAGWEIALRCLRAHGPAVPPPVADGRVAGTPYQPAASATDLGSVSGMSVVIEGDRAPFGALAILSSTPRTFSLGDFEFAQSVAGVVTQMLLRAHHGRDCARLASVVAATGEGIIGITQNGRIFDWNEAAVRLYGYSRSETIGRSLTEVFQLGLPNQFLAMLELGCQRATLGPFETVLRRNDGTQVASEVRLVPIVPLDGRIVSASMIARDLREKRRTDDALSMHADILAHIPPAVVVWRLDDLHDPSSLRLVLANRTARDLAGCSLDARAGTRFAEASLRFSDADEPGLYAEVARTVRPRNLGERRLFRADGSQRTYDVHAFPLPDQCVGVAFHDVTERRELTDKLRHAERLEVIGRSAGGIAHDVNNMLSVISGCAELLAPAIGNNEVALGDLREIERASRSAGQLTRQLLASGPRPELRSTNVDLSAVLRSVRGMLKPLIRADIQMVTLAEEAVPVCANPLQIEQVILNLCINARDAMPAGGVLLMQSRFERLSCRIAQRYGVVPAGAYGVLEVADTGTGMDQATLARIFEPFFTTKDVGSGTGLGLATVHGIITQSGGHITVDSEPGKGTIFRVYLPAAG